MSTYPGSRNRLFDCCQDVGVCLAWSFCFWTGVPQAINWARARQEDCTACHCCCEAHQLWTRRRIRVIKGDNTKQDGADWCLYLWCCCCAGAQDTRELKLIAQSAAGMQLPLVQPGGQQQPYS
jgi:hypothetical protein